MTLPTWRWWLLAGAGGYGACTLLLVALAWVLSPIDLLPDLLPVVGPLDDVVAVVLLLRHAHGPCPARRRRAPD